jgi:predicted RNA-binding protein with PIN domain
MQLHTIDLQSDEVVILALLLAQYVETQTKRLRQAQNDVDAEQTRMRLAIATSLRGKLPKIDFRAQV